jgi:hypothetical protein
LTIPIDNSIEKTSLKSYRSTAAAQCPTLSVQGVTLQHKLNNGASNQVENQYIVANPQQLTLKIDTKAAITASEYY